MDVVEICDRIITVASHIANDPNEKNTETKHLVDLIKLLIDGDEEDYGVSFLEQISERG